MLHKTKLMSMVLVAITALLLATSATPAKAAPLVERINSWYVDSIDAYVTDCDFASNVNQQLIIHQTINVAWNNGGGGPFGGIQIYLYSASNEEISRAGGLPGGGTRDVSIRGEIGVGPSRPNPVTPVRPWKLVAYENNNGIQGEAVGTLIFDPADYGVCEDLPYVGIQTGLDSDPIADTSAQDTAIYNSLDDDGNPSLDVYGINDEGEGYYAFTITEDDLAPFADNPPEENTEIMTVDNVALYVLTTGEYQLNIGPDEEGKVRVVIFNGLPPTNVYSYDYNVYDILGE